MGNAGLILTWHVSYQSSTSMKLALRQRGKSKNKIQREKGLVWHCASKSEALLFAFPGIFSAQLFPDSLWPDWVVSDGLALFPCVLWSRLAAKPLTDSWSAKRGRGAAEREIRPRVSEMLAKYGHRAAEIPGPRVLFHLDQQRERKLATSRTLRTYGCSTTQEFENTVTWHSTLGRINQRIVWPQFSH